ncbi:MAG: cytochrome c-type biogenesis protein CcmH [Thiomicrorhabdus sp.]|nr:MAG: cytochrome c-type biogenesis protein CcmH [Thiomicrorhabdus sp.]
MFLVVTGLIAVVIIVWALYPLLRSKKDDSPDLQSVNARILEDQLVELDFDLDQGVINQGQHRSARVDLQRTFLETASQKEIDSSQHTKNNPILILVLAVVLPSSAYFIYDQVGTNTENIRYMSDRASARQSTQVVGQEDPHTTQGGVDVSAMVQRVKQKALANPDDLDSWRMLAQSLQVMRDYDGAAKAYLHLINKGVKDAEIYFRYADILAAQAGGLLLDTPSYQWILKALQIDPNHQQSLWIAGTAAYYSKDYVLAEKYWSHLLSLLEPGTETYQAIKQNLIEVSKSNITQ